MRTHVSAVCASIIVLLAPAAVAQPLPPVPAPAPPPAPPVAPEPQPEPPPVEAPPEPAPGSTPGSAPGPDADAAPAPPQPTGLAAVEPAPVDEKIEGFPPVPLAPPAIFPSQLDAEDAPPTAGIHQGRVFLRSEDDNFRLYPGGWMATDFYWAPDAPDLDADQGVAQLEPYLAVRRARLELSGELFQRLSFTLGVELGGGRVGDTPYVGDATPRSAMASAHDGEIRPAQVSVNYAFRRWLNFTIGQFNAPFSMSNRTHETVTPFMERSIAIRGFVVPNEKELGLSVWGELDERLFAYELGVFSGDGPSEPAVDARPDVMGRLFARPLATMGDSVFFEQAQIGVSLRHGEKDQDRVAYDYPGIATNHGFVMWQPGYVDSLGRVTHITPSGAQNAIGGELRLPFQVPSGAVFDIRGEAYYLENNTREAVDGFELTNTERFGRVKGVGWYATVSWWACCSDQLVSGEPGVYRPATVDLADDSPTLRGLEVLLTAGGVAANYSGATREDSQPDANTPNSDITLYQFGGGIQFWYAKNFRVLLNYMLYFAPDSGDPAQNQAIVPDNLFIEDGARGGGHIHHELGTRLSVSF